jgi:hypothetical protein
MAERDAMILCKANSTDGGAVRPAWKTFAEVQQGSAPIAGFVSQAAHAALAGQLAAALSPNLFGHLPDDVTEAVAHHDQGWSCTDLLALENVDITEPACFLAVPPEKAVEAWRRSITDAENRATLQSVLTSRHFCALAPRDEHPAHQAFRREEDIRRTLIETDFRPEDLERWTAALGFCDLVSLCLCAGMQGRFELPAAHPAQPSAAKALQVALDIAPGSIRFGDGALREQCDFFVVGWERTASGSGARVTSRRWSWTAAVRTSG